MEDRTNRQLRETLIIKGVPEIDNESWENTSQIAAKIFSDTVASLSYDNANGQIKRAHREKPNERRKGHRHIIVAVYNWKLCEELKRVSRNLKFPIEQKYGPLTTWRRNQALKCRQSLKADKKIIRGIVEFPAKLMVIYSYQNSKKYVLHEDFSKSEVVFTKPIAEDS